MRKNKLPIIIFLKINSNFSVYPFLQCTYFDILQKEANISIYVNKRTIDILKNFLLSPSFIWPHTVKKKIKPKRWYFPPPPPQPPSWLSFEYSLQHYNNHKINFNNKSTKKVFRLYLLPPPHCHDFLGFTLVMIWVKGSIKVIASLRQLESSSFNIYP